MLTMRLTIELSPARELLTLARDLISAPDQFCTHALARDAAGAAVWECASAACRWDAYGAINRVSRGENRVADHASKLLSEATFALYKVWAVSQINDGANGRVRIIKAFNCAIERAISHAAWRPRSISAAAINADTRQRAFRPERPTRDSASEILTICPTHIWAHSGNMVRQR